jgi:riboflavin synthase
MFTGLIEAIGRVEEVQAATAGRRIRLATPLGADLTPGESIAVSGVCLTVTHADASGFGAEVSPQTLSVTTTGEWTLGRLVNLERSLRADARLGGHFVLGHVDAVGRVVSIRAEGDHHWLDVQAPETLGPLLIDKGSVAIDGISLTIASVTGARIGMQIVPFTFAHTALAGARVGDRVNLEADVLGKHVARLLGWKDGVRA